MKIIVSDVLPAAHREHENFDPMQPSYCIEFVDGIRAMNISVHCGYDDSIALAKVFQGFISGLDGVGEVELVDCMKD